MRETPNALQAFEDYWALGPDRSLQALLNMYRTRVAQGESAPTTSWTSLSLWSRTHHWQQRVRERIAEEAEKLRQAARERSIRFRGEVLRAIETDVRRYLMRLADSDEEMLAEDAASLERLVRLHGQLAEWPLADRTEITGPEGRPLEVRLYEHLSIAELAEIAQQAEGDPGAGDEGGTGSETE